MSGAPTMPPMDEQDKIRARVFRGEASGKSYSFHKDGAEKLNFFLVGRW